jgi:acetylglutamate kinase
MEQLFVVKIGGNVIDAGDALKAFLHDFAQVPGKKILVHGGGKIATAFGEKLGIVPNYINGRRITDDATLELVTMVYGGLINKRIVAALQSGGCNAIGLTGADGNVAPAVKRPVKGTDFGWVGDIKESIETNTLELLLDNGLIPVLAPLTHDGTGQLLNTNADTIASAIAVSLSKKYKVRLVYCFEKKGVLENIEDSDSVISLITKEKYESLLQENKLFEGILPKIDNAFAAIGKGVSEVLIGDAKDLLQNTGSTIKGTLFK